MLVAGLLLVVGCQAKKPNEVPPLAAEELQPPLPVEPAPVAVTEVETTTGPEGKPSSAPSAGSQTYTMKAGDTLYSLARRFYSDGKLWTKIFEANKDKIRDVSDIPIGTVLVIPPK
jgi:nucleoid-associated protein YgaU